MNGFLFNQPKIWKAMMTQTVPMSHSTGRTPINGSSLGKKLVDEVAMATPAVATAKPSAVSPPVSPPAPPRVPDAWNEVFVRPVIYTVDKLPALSESLRIALFAPLPPLEIPSRDVRQAVWQSSEQFAESADHLADELTRTEPVRRRMYLAHAALAAAVTRHTAKLTTQLSDLRKEMQSTNRWQRAYPQSRTVNADDTFANLVFQLKTMTWLTILIAFVLFTALSLSRIVVDAFGAESMLEIAGFCLPTALITLALAKILFLQINRPSARFTMWLKVFALGFGLPIMIMNISLIGLQQEELVIPLDGSEPPPAAWYTAPALRCISIALVDFVCVVCFTALYKHQTAQAITDHATLTPAFRNMDACNGATTNLLAELDALQGIVAQVAQSLKADRDGFINRLTAAHKAERWRLEAKMDQILATHMKD